MDERTRDELISYLGEFVTLARASKVQQVLDKRTRHLTVVMEDIENAHNGSAALRSCEALGIQDVHFIENKFRNKISAYVAKGGSKWLSLHKYGQTGHDNTTDCLQGLKKNGYEIWLTSPDQEAEDISKVTLTSKVALVFGTEFNGVSGQAQALADKKVCLPMNGFTESYNVSVSVALCLYILTEKLKDSEMEWCMSDEEKKQLTLEWYRKIVKRSDLHEARFFSGR